MTKNKIQTFFIKTLVKPVGFIEKFGFYKGLDKENRNVFQMDEATFKNKNVLWQKPKCCLQSNLDGSDYLLFNRLNLT